MRRFNFISAVPGIALALAASLPACAASNAADVAHLHVQLVFPQTQLARGAKREAGLYFKLEQGWHVYWQNPGDSGGPPQIKWTLPAGMTAGPLQFPAPERLPLGPLMDFGYENEVFFPFSVEAAKTAKDGPALLYAKVNWLVCRDVCIPGKAELEENIRVAATGGQANPADQALWNRFEQKLPAALPADDTAVFQAGATGFRLRVDTGHPEVQAAFFPEDPNIIDNPAAQNVTPTAKGMILNLKKDPSLTSAPARLNGVLELAGGRNYQIAAVRGTVAAPPETAQTTAQTGAQTTPQTGTGAMVRIAGLAFLGGLLLNLMPCVFPVLFLKGLALVQSGSEAGVPTDRFSSMGWRKERGRLRAHGIVYTAGILVSFWILVAVLLGLRATGATLGWGFQFQSPVFLFLLDGLFFFLGLSLAGQFEFGISLTGAGSGLAAKQGYTGSFFTGVLAVVVATPCAAPFMGAAIGYALAQSAGITFAVFTALALGLAAPYLFLTLQPSWTRLLPRPGSWMEVLKQAASLFMFGTVVWLTWVLAQAYGATSVAIVLSSFMVLAIAGWFLGRWPARRWSTAVAVALWLCVAGMAVFNQRIAASDLSAPAGDGAAPAAAGEWQPWSAPAVESGLTAGRPVFVDFTASWCLSCQVNERVALRQPEVQRAFASRNVLLLKADWTRENPEITQALAGMGRSGVPVYAFYIPGENKPRLLPQVLTPGIVVDAIDQLPRAGTEAPREQGN